MALREPLASSIVAWFESQVSPIEKAGPLSSTLPETARAAGMLSSTLALPFEGTLALSWLLGISSLIDFERFARPAALEAEKKTEVRPLDRKTDALRLHSAAGFAGMGLKPKSETLDVQFGGGKGQPSSEIVFVTVAPQAPADAPRRGRR